MKRPIVRLLTVIVVLSGILLVMLNISGTRKAAEGEDPNRTVTEESVRKEPEIKPQKKPEAEAETEQEAEGGEEPVTETAEETQPELQPEPEPKPETKPEPKPEPEPEPEPQEEPEPEEETVPEDSVTSGSFTSSTGTALNLKVDWTLTTQGGNSTLNLTVGLTSYSLQVGSRSGGLSVVVNGEAHGFNTNAITYDGSDLVTNTLATCEIPLSKHSADIQVSWAFNGTYSGTSISSITASGKAK